MRAFSPLTLPGGRRGGGASPSSGPIYKELLSGTQYTGVPGFRSGAAGVVAPVPHSLRSASFAPLAKNPTAVDTAGISVQWLRYRAMLICGVLCGLGRDLPVHRPRAPHSCAI